MSCMFSPEKASCTASIASSATSTNGAKVSRMLSSEKACTTGSKVSRMLSSEKACTTGSKVSRMLSSEKASCRSLPTSLQKSAPSAWVPVASRAPMRIVVPSRDMVLLYAQR